MQRGLTIATVIAFCAVAGCSKPAVESAVDAANTVGEKLMSGVVQKDASTQVEGLIRNLENRSDCAIYKDRLREVERASPYDGSTQLVIAKTYGAAGKAGCVKAF
jgi:hypothetical protein